MKNKGTILAQQLMNFEFKSSKRFIKFYENDGERPKFDAFKVVIIVNYRKQRIAAFGYIAS